MANHNLQYRDVRVNNVPTNVRGFGETRYNGNSIFVFDLADLCIAHLGHLHHTLTEAHLAEIGTIDIVLVPVDGSFTLNQPEMIEVLKQLKAKIAIPMHVFTEETLARFLARAEERGFGVRHAPEPRITVTALRPAGAAGNPGAAGAVAVRVICVTEPAQARDPSLKRRAPANLGELHRRRPKCRTKASEKCCGGSAWSLLRRC